MELKQTTEVLAEKYKDSAMECKHGFEVDDTKVDFEGKESEARYIPVDMKLEGSKRLAVEQVGLAEQVEQVAEQGKHVEPAVEPKESAGGQVETIAELVETTVETIVGDQQVVLV